MGGSSLWQSVTLASRVLSAGPGCHKGRRTLYTTVKAVLLAVLQAAWELVRPVVEPCLTRAQPVWATLHKTLQPAFAQDTARADVLLSRYQPWQVALVSFLLALLAQRLLRWWRRIARDWSDKGKHKERSARQEEA